MALTMVRVPSETGGAGRAALQVRPECADDRGGAIDGACDGVVVGEVAFDDAQVRTRRGDLRLVADVGGNGVAVGEQLVDDVTADVAGCAKDGDVAGLGGDHRWSSSLRIWGRTSVPSSSMPFR